MLAHDVDDRVLVLTQTLLTVRQISEALQGDVDIGTGCLLAFLSHEQNSKITDLPVLLIVPSPEERLRIQHVVQEVLLESSRQRTALCKHRSRNRSPHAEEKYLGLAESGCHSCAIQCNTPTYPPPVDEASRQRPRREQPLPSASSLQHTCKQPQAGEKEVLWLNRRPGLTHLTWSRPSGFFFSLLFFFSKKFQSSGTFENRRIL